MDQVREADGIANLIELRIGDIFPVVDKIFTDGSFKQPRILQNHAENIVHGFPLHILRADAVDRDFSLIYLIETHQQVDHRRLAGAGRPDNRDLLSDLDIGRKVMDDLAVFIVAEADVFKLHIAFYVLDHGRLRAFVLHLLLVQEGEDPLTRRCHGLQGTEGLRQILQRVREVADVEHERHDYAEGDLAADSQDRTGYADNHVGEVADKHHQRLHDTAEKL